MSKDQDWAIAYQQAVATIEQVCDARDRLRAQVAELLPLVAELAEFITPDREFGECAWYDWNPGRQCFPEIGGIKHDVDCPVFLAKGIVARIDAGEFGEVAP